MKKYILTSIIFNVSKEFDTIKELQSVIGFSNYLIYKLLETGEEKHGYILDVRDIDESERKCERL